MHPLLVLNAALGQGAELEHFVEVPDDESNRFGHAELSLTLLTFDRPSITAVRGCGQHNEGSTRRRQFDAGAGG